MILGLTQGCKFFRSSSIPCFLDIFLGNTVSSCTAGSHMGTWSCSLDKDWPKLNVHVRSNSISKGCSSIIYQWEKTYLETSLHALPFFRSSWYRRRWSMVLQSKAECLKATITFKRACFPFGHHSTNKGTGIKHLGLAPLEPVNAINMEKRSQPIEY